MLLDFVLHIVVACTGMFLHVVGNSEFFTNHLFDCLSACAQDNGIGDAGVQLMLRCSFYDCTMDIKPVSRELACF